MKSTAKLLPPTEWQLPEVFPQLGRAPAALVPSGAGRHIAWVEGYVGLRWRICEPIDLAGERSAGLVMMQTPCYSEAAGRSFDQPPAWLTSPASHRRVGAANQSSMPDLWMRGFFA